MKIVWDRVTKFSQIVAIVLFVAVLWLGFAMGRKYEDSSILGEPIANAKFACAESKTIEAEFYDRYVRLEFGKQKNLYLPQTISASGARYANKDESIVFWNKGDTAFITEGDPNSPTYKDCNIVNK